MWCRSTSGARPDRAMPRLLRREENRVPLPGWRGTYFKGDAIRGRRWIFRHMSRRLQAERDSLSAKALQVVILTACRTSEALLADWSELDLESRIWTIPGSRMKAGKEHRVPLSDAVVGILESLPTRKGWLFPGARHGKPLSNMAMTMVLRKIGHPDLTVHGFRSTFRDWCAEETHYANIIAEQALAHSIDSAVEAAYRRGDLLEKRRALMADWAGYCTTRPAANVVPIRGNAA